MHNSKTFAAFILGILLGISTIIASGLLANSALQIKQYERTVLVKGLSERDVAADTAIWPIRFSVAGSNASDLYQLMETNAAKISEVLATMKSVPMRRVLPTAMPNAGASQTPAYVIPLSKPLPFLLSK